MAKPPVVLQLFRVPVCWNTTGTAIVEAETLEDAKMKIKNGAQYVAIVDAKAEMIKIGVV